MVDVTRGVSNEGGIGLYRQEEGKANGGEGSGHCSKTVFLHAAARSGS